MTAKTTGKLPMSVEEVARRVPVASSTMAARVMPTEPESCCSTPTKVVA